MCLMFLRVKQSLMDKINQRCCFQFKCKESKYILQLLLIVNLETFYSESVWATGKKNGLHSGLGNHTLIAKARQGSFIKHI